MREVVRKMKNIVFFVIVCCVLIYYSLSRMNLKLRLTIKSVQYLQTLLDFLISLHWIKKKIWYLETPWRELTTNIQLSRGIRNTLKKEVDFSGYEFDKVSTAAKDFIRGRNNNQFALQALHLSRAAAEEASRETERPPVSGPRLAQEGWGGR